MNSLVPSKKVTTGTLSGAVVVILVWVVGRFAGVEVPPEVAAAATVLVAGGVAYFVRNKPKQPKHAPETDG